MDLHNLPKTTSRKLKRKGRGYGSGVGGHTCTRGQKGQKSRSSVKIWFEGGQLPLAKRLPFLRGKDRFKSLTQNQITITTDQLSVFKANSKITKEALVKQNLVSLKEAASDNIKILSGGKLDKALTIVDIKTSSQAAKIISKAGGTIETSEKPATK